jgi:hypothetical protein
MMNPVEMHNFLDDDAFVQQKRLEVKKLFEDGVERVTKKLIEQKEKEKANLKRSTYDDALYAEIAAEKQRRLKEHEEYKKSLCQPVPLPTEEAMEGIIKDIHRIIAETEEVDFLDFLCYSVTKEEGIRFLPYAGLPWLEAVKDWLETTRNNASLNVAERSILADHAREGIEKFFQHICERYNAKHSASSAKCVEGGFRVFY